MSLPQKAIAAALSYGRMIKFSHSIFALPFVLSALVLAVKEDSIRSEAVILTLIALVAARTAAMGFNRIADAGIDAKNPRTAVREIPKGEISIRAALVFVLLSSLIFLLTAFALGPLCGWLSIPLLIFLFSYSYTKRFTLLCHFYLGFAIGLAPTAAWIALTGNFNYKVLLLSAVLITHIAGFDILYACQDLDFDIKEKLHSIPAKLGVSKALKLAKFTHGLCAFFIFSLYPAFDLGPVFLVFALLVTMLLIIEHRIVKEDDLSNVPIAFFNINSVISLLLFTGILLDIWLIKGF